MTTVDTDRLVDDYLHRLDAAASALPPGRRAELISEIRGHVQESLRENPANDEAAVRNLLERLGPPEDIVSAAGDSPPSGHLVAAPRREINGSAIVSVVLGVLWLAWIGSVLAIVFGFRARRQIKNSAGSQRGSALAIAGIILGSIGILLLLIAAGAAIAAIVAPSGGSGVPVPVTTP
jgi:uncharacterized membrane protein